MEEIKRFTFRLPTELFNQIELIAKENRRSVNSEVIVAIEKYLELIKMLENSNDNN